MSKKSNLPRKLTGSEVIAIRPGTHGDFTDGAIFTQSVLRLALPMPGHARMTDVHAQRRRFGHATCTPAPRVGDPFARYAHDGSLGDGHARHHRRALPPSSRHGDRDAAEMVDGSDGARGPRWV